MVVGSGVVVRRTLRRFLGRVVRMAELEVTDEALIDVRAELVEIVVVGG